MARIVGWLDKTKKKKKDKKDKRREGDGKKKRRENRKERRRIRIRGRGRVTLLESVKLADKECLRLYGRRNARHRFYAAEWS